MNIDELYNILLTDKPSIILKEKEKEIFLLIPELEKCKSFNQNNKWHIYDVYNHILHVIDNTKPNLVLRLSALFHDIGKPLTYTEDKNGVGHFYGHYIESQKIFDDFANKHNIDSNMIKLVSTLVYHHDNNILKLDDENLMKLYNILGTDGINLLYELKKADLLAQNEIYHYLLDEYNIENEKVLDNINKLIKK